jgi:general secretion pathway protein N
VTRRRIITFAAILGLLAAIIFMPLRVVLASDAIAARKVEGIVWDGAIRDLQVAGLRIGDVNARLHALPLLLARAKFSLARGDAPLAPGITGSITRGLGGFSVEGLTATLPVASLFAPLPAANLEFRDFSARFIAGRCVDSGGSVRLTMPAGIAGLDLSNGLLATPRCERGQLLIPLLSQSAMEHVDIRIAADGGYSATIFLEGDRAEQAGALSLAGFRPVAGGFRMVTKGKF